MKKHTFFITVIYLFSLLIFLGGSMSDSYLNKISSTGWLFWIGGLLQLSIIIFSALTINRFIKNNKFREAYFVSISIGILGLAMPHIQNFFIN